MVVGSTKSGKWVQKWRFLCQFIQESGFQLPLPPSSSPSASRMTQAVILCFVYLQETLHLLSILYSHEELKSMCVIQITHLSFFSVLKLLTHSQTQWLLLGCLLHNHVWTENVAGAELTARPWLAVFPCRCRFAVMACCWALDPEERPKFQQLVQCLTEFHAALGAYVWPLPDPQLGRKCLLQMPCL